MPFGGHDWFACADLDGAPDAEAVLDRLDAFAALAPVAEAEGIARKLLLLEPGSRVLEVGCGTGRELARLVAEGAEVTGVDRSARALARAKRQAGGAALVRADATDLPFADGSFDALRLTRVLQHVAKPEHALAEAARVLRPGGRIAVSEGTQRVVGDATEPTGDRVRGWIGLFVGTFLNHAGFTGVTPHNTRGNGQLVDGTTLHVAVTTWGAHR